METAPLADLTWRLALLGVVIALDAVAFIGLVVKELREQQAESGARWVPRSGRRASLGALTGFARRQLARGFGYLS